MGQDILGYGIIGCGVIGPTHADAVQKAEGAEIRAVCDIEEDKAKEFAEKYEVESWYQDYHEMLARDDLQIISICTPSGMHSDMGIDCAKAGKHILCEKPIDIDLGKIDKLISAAKKNKVKLGVIFQRRTYETSRLVREAVQGGELGKMIRGDAYLKCYRSQEYYETAGWRGTWQWDGGGCLMNQGVHGIDLLLWIMGEVDTIYGKVGTLARKIEVEDTADAMLTYKDGAFGVIQGTTSVYPGLPCRSELHGEKGTIILEEQNIKLWDTVDGGKREFAEGGVAGGTSDPTAIAAVGHALQVQDLVNAIREDRDPLITGEEGRKAVEVILAIYRSSETGKLVKLPLK